MVKRIVTKIGYVFCVEIDNEYKVFFQYVANDLSQLNSSVIRVFKKHYPMDYVPDMDEIVKDQVDFYAHTVLRYGIVENAWYKVGKHPDLGDVENIGFRWFSEGNHDKMTKSYKWYVWKINQEFQHVGEMTKKYKHLDIGVVIPYFFIVEKIRTGKYTFKILD
jgi:hypothetical protein